LAGAVEAHPRVRGISMGVSAKHFELWGYPGAGKSTISNVLQTKCRVLPPPQPSGLNHGVAGSLTAMVFAGIGAFTDNFREIESRQKKKAFVAAAAKLQVRLATEHDPPVLFEEGITHHVWRALYTEPSFVKEDWWRAHIRQNTAQVIVLNVSRHVAQSRIRSKAEPGPVNLELRDAPLNDDRLQRAHAAFEAIDNELTASSPPVARLHVDHDGVVEASAKVYTIVANHGHHAPLTPAASKA
jgi:hypothetical protein